MHYVNNNNFYQLTLNNKFNILKNIILYIIINKVKIISDRSFLKLLSN